VGLRDVLFPYRARRQFGAASYALVFLVILAEIELLTFIGLALVARRPDLFIPLQDAVLPASCLVSLAATTVFWWRARHWTEREHLAAGDELERRRQLRVLSRLD
jgi:hypothetical protein